MCRIGQRTDPPPNEPYIPNPTTNSKPHRHTTTTHAAVHLPDSNPRAFVYVSGRTPNRWGYMDGGKKLVDYLASVAPDVRLYFYMR